MEISEKLMPCVTETIGVDNLLHVQLLFVYEFTVTASTMVSSWAKLHIDQ